MLYRIFIGRIEGPPTIGRKSISQILDDLNRALGAR